MRFLGGVIAVACVASVACSSSSTPGSSASDSGTQGDTGGTSDGGGGACNAPADTAPTIAATCDSTASQSATGGSIADGTYFATADVSLGGSPCSSAYVPSTTLQIANGVFAFSYAPAPGLGEEHQQFSYSVSGSQVTTTLLCDTDPNGTVGTTGTQGFTATATQLTLLFPSCCGDSYPGENVTFTRQ